MSRHAAALLAAAVGIVIACAPAAPPPPAAPTSAVQAAAERVSGGKLIVGFSSDASTDAKTLDPQLVGGGSNVHSIFSAMFDQLVYQDPTSGDVVPGLAHSWDVSPDGKQYTFHLDPNAKFWDGTPVTADDAKFSLDRSVDKQYRPNNAYVSSLMASYDHSVAVDAHTLQVFLQNTQASFLAAALARDYLSVVPRAYVEKVGVQQFAMQPMGSGPFELEEFVPGDHITVKRNPDYAWGPAFFATAGKPASVARIEFHFISEDSTRLAALQSGQVNAIQSVPPFDEAQLKATAGFSVLPVQKNGQTAGLNIQTQRAPTDDLAVRQAIAYVIDRDTLNKNVYAGVEKPAVRILEDRMGSWVNQSATFPSRDVSRAQQILDQAGWVAGADGIRVKNGVRLQLLGICLPAEQQGMTEIQTELRSVGIGMDIQTGSSAQMSTIVSGSGEFNLAWQSELGFPGADPSMLFSLYDSQNIPPKGTTNFGKVSVPDVDQLLEAGDRTLDRGQRKDAYDKAQQMLTDYVAYIPLLSLDVNLATVSGVNGLVPDIRGQYIYFKDVWLDASAQSKWPAN